MAKEHFTRERKKRILEHLIEKQVHKGIDFNKARWAKKFGMSLKAFNALVKPLEKKAQQEVKEIQQSMDSITLIEMRLAQAEKKLKGYKKELKILERISEDRTIVLHQLEGGKKLTVENLDAYIETLIDGETAVYFHANYVKSKKFKINNVKDEFIHNILHQLKSNLRNGTVYRKTKILEQRVHSLNMELPHLKQKIQLQR